MFVQSKVAAMKKDYQIASRSDRRALAEFLSKEGQLLLPMLKLIEQAELAVDELIDVAGRATIEAVQDARKGTPVGRGQSA